LVKQFHDREARIISDLANSRGKENGYALRAEMETS
jgi:hypothetical protein